MGLREYDVRGIGALRTAIYQVDGGLHIHFGAQPEADEPESVSALRRVYRKARMVAVQATLFTAAISGADDVAKIVGKTARYFLPPPAVEQADIGT